MTLVTQQQQQRTPSTASTLQRRGGLLLSCSTAAAVVSIVMVAMITVTSTASFTPPQKKQEQEFKIGSMYSHRRYNYKRKMELRDEVQKAFYHGFDSYMTYAFPSDEVKPISCGKHDNFAGYAVTAVDSLDTLALMGDYRTFMSIIKKLDDHLQFNANRKISVFETTIRILGGLVSAHHLALKISAEARFGPKRDTYIKSEADEALFTYKGEMLRKAVILADKLMPVFDTPTGIPFSETNLAHPLSGRGGGNQNCPAGAGTLLLEFGALGALTGNCSYLLAAERALEAVWKHRGSQGLVGSELNIMSGAWVFPEATIGASVDSFYEYIHKAYVMFGEEKYLKMWHEAYKAIQKYTYFGGWYIMSSVHQKGPLDTLDHKFNSLTTFWPGLQTLAGDVHNALDSYSKMHCVLKKVGYFPEYLDLASFFAGNPSFKKTHGFHYPLRPEFIESTLFLYKATGEEKLLEIAETFFVNFLKTKHRCGFAALKNVFDKTFEDSMESFVLAETLKYLYIIFTPSKAEIDAENSMRYEQRQVRLRQVAIDSKAYQRRRAHHSAIVNKIVDNELITALTATAEAEELQSAHVEYKKLVTASPPGQVPSLKSVEEYKILGYPTEERPITYEAPLYDLENGYIVNTEAHPIPLDINHHDFSKTCEWNRKNEKMDANTWSRISDSFRFFVSEDKSISSLSEWEKAHMCPKVDYMRDVAPFIQRQFYSSGVADPCVELPDTQVLGDKSTTHFTTKNYATSLSPNKNARLKQIKADLDTREIIIRMTIELPPDPLAGALVSGGALHAGSVTKHIATELSTRVSGPGASAINPKIIEYMGILGIPLVNEVENLYQLERNIMIRRVGPAPITLVDFESGNYLPTYVQPFDRIRSDGAPWFDRETHSRNIYSPADAFFETSNANFGPKICPRDTTPRASLNVWATGPVFRASVDPTGCLPSHVGDTSMYPKPFGIASLRGGCTFREKALSAQLQGASFVIIVNTNDEYILMGDGVTEVPELMGLEVTIPLMAISKTLAESILPPVNVHLTVRDEARGAAATSLPPSTILSIVCARNAPEQYKLIGAELTKIGDLAVMYRKRNRPLVEAFRSMINDPGLRKDYAGHQRIQCHNCYLNVNYFSGDSFSKSANMLSELDVGFRAGFDLPRHVYGEEAVSLEKHYSKLLMGAFRGADGSRLQFALAPRPFYPSRRGVGLPASSKLANEDPGVTHYMSAVGVVYFFTKGSNMGVAQISTYTINDGEAYAYYANQLGAWLEENGSDEVGLNAHFSAIHEINNYQVHLSEVIPSSLQSQQYRKTLVGSKVVEINIFEDVESCNAFNDPQFPKKEYTRGHTLRLMRNQFITEVRTPTILNVNEAFRFPHPGPRSRKGFP